MKVLILGSGGREHALAWAVKRSKRVTEVVCAPGNGGIARDCALRSGGFEGPGRHGSAGRGRAAGADHRRAGAAAFAGHCGCAARARPARLWAHAGRGHAGNQQGLRQALPAAAQHSHRQLRGLHQRGRGGKGRRVLPSAHRGQGRRAGTPAKASSSASRARPPSKPRRACSPARCWAQRSSRSSSRSFSKATRSAFSA